MFFLATFKYCVLFLGTVAACKAAGSLNPIAIYKCIKDIVEVGNSCRDCICYVMSKFGVDCADMNVTGN